MPKLFFERMKEKRGEYPTTFSYGELPVEVRRQVVMIIGGCIHDEDYARMAWAMREAIGVFKLADGDIRDEWGVSEHSFEKEIVRYFLTEPNIDRVLSVLELIGYALGTHRSGQIDRINERLRLAGIGWSVTPGGPLLRIEDETFFENVTSESLSVLNSGRFSKAYHHYIDAYDALKKTKFDQALTECGKAIESVIKSRLTDIGISDVSNKNWNALKPLLNTHLVIPTYMESFANNLFSLMEGVPTARNKDGAHGKEDGAASQVDDVFVRYIINQTAASLLFIAEAEFR